MFNKKSLPKGAYKILRGKTFSKTNVSNIVIGVISDIFEIDDEEDLDLNLTLADLNATSDGVFVVKKTIELNLEHTIPNVIKLDRTIADIIRLTCDRLRMANLLEEHINIALC